MGTAQAYSDRLDAQGYKKKMEKKVTLNSDRERKSQPYLLSRQAQASQKADKPLPYGQGRTPSLTWVVTTLKQGIR
jgi:hypothetical protein